MTRKMLVRCGDQGWEPPSSFFLVTLTPSGSQPEGNRTCSVEIAAAVLAYQASPEP